MPDEKCDYCDISDIKLITRFKNWELVQCNRCGLRWGTPRPDPRSLPQLYDQNYFNSTQAKFLGYTNYENERHLIIRTFESRFKDIEMYKPSVPVSMSDVPLVSRWMLQENEDGIHTEQTCQPMLTRLF